MSDPPVLDPSQRATVLQVAVEAIRAGLGTGRPLQIDAAKYPEILQRETASFVTLFIDGKLRGCCGSVLPTEPLIVNVARSAASAAFRDPRFEPLMDRELPRLKLHVSLLSHPLPMHYQDENDLRSQIRPGIDGLILHFREHQGVLLPAVWKKVADPGEFLRQLKIKATLPPVFWSSEIRVQRFTVEEIVGYAAELTGQEIANHV